MIPITFWCSCPLLIIHCFCSLCRCLPGIYLMLDTCRCSNRHGSVATACQFGPFKNWIALVRPLVAAAGKSRIDWFAASINSAVTWCMNALLAMLKPIALQKVIQALIISRLDPGHYKKWQEAIDTAMRGQIPVSGWDWSLNLCKTVEKFGGSGSKRICECMKTSWRSFLLVRDFLVKNCRCAPLILKLWLCHCKWPSSADKG